MDKIGKKHPFCILFVIMLLFYKVKIINFNFKIDIKMEKIMKFYQKIASIMLFAIYTTSIFGADAATLAANLPVDVEDVINEHQGENVYMIEVGKNSRIFFFKYFINSGTNI